MYGHTEQPEHWVRHMLLLRDIQKSLYDRARAYRDARTVTANSLEEFKTLFPVRKNEDEELPIDALRFE